MVEEKVIAQALCTHQGEGAFCDLMRVMGFLYLQDPELKQDEAADKELLEKGSYTEENYMYGFTYMPSWLKVFTRPAVQAAVEMARGSPQPRPVLVLGSTIGWQAFYATLIFQLPSIGFELLPSRVTIAKQAQALLPPTAQAMIRFLQEDALLADLSGASIVYLTSLGWDQGLVTRLHEKLAQEMEQDAVVIANSFPNISAMENFTVLDSLCVPVSWSTSQIFHIYRKAQPADTARSGPVPDKCDDTKADARTTLLERAGFVDVAVATLQDTLEWLFQEDTQQALSSCGIGPPSLGGSVPQAVLDAVTRVLKDSTKPEI